MSEPHVCRCISDSNLLSLEDPAMTSLVWVHSVSYSSTLLELIHSEIRFVSPDESKLLVSQQWIIDSEPRPLELPISPSSLSLHPVQASGNGEIVLKVGSRENSECTLDKQEPDPCSFHKINLN